MGTKTFHLPPNLSETALRCLTYGYAFSNVELFSPWPTQIDVTPTELTMKTPIEESCSLCVPWEVEGFGRLMLSTTTLTDWSSPYSLPMELLRGQVNQLRIHADYWERDGIQIPNGLRDRIQSASRLFAEAVCRQDQPDELNELARRGLAESVAAGQDLVRAYVDQALAVRLQADGSSLADTDAGEDGTGKPVGAESPPRLGTRWGCLVTGAPPEAEASEKIEAAFNMVQVAFPWPEIEAQEGDFCWAKTDALVAWAMDHHLDIAAGPLIDFTPSALPVWLKDRNDDWQRLGDSMARYVEMALRKYGNAITAWQPTAAINRAAGVRLPREDRLRLVHRIHEAAHSFDDEAHLILGLAQPWSEYIATEERGLSAFLFADTLMRNRVPIAALDLELVFGVRPRGSHLRELIEVNRLLNLFSLLGLPLRVTLGCPASNQPDSQAFPEYEIESYSDHGDWSPEIQESLATDIAPLALCKTIVEAVRWAQVDDRQPHPFPQCGLIGPDGERRPAWNVLHDLRDKYLR